MIVIIVDAGNFIAYLLSKEVARSSSMMSLLVLLYANSDYRKIIQENLLEGDLKK